MLAGLLRHRLDRLVIINGHGGNSQAIHDTTLEVRRAHGAVILCLSLWKVAAALMPRLGAPDPARIGHGADPVASVAMHLWGAAPVRDRVRVAAPRFDRLPVSAMGSVTFEGVPIEAPLEWADVAPDGMAPWADPTQARGDDGAHLTGWLVEIGAALVAHVAGRDDAPEETGA